MAEIHVPLERKFAPYSDERFRDPDYTDVWGIPDSGDLQWEDLHKCRCVVFLGEGKCGKTHEFRQQNRKLRENGQFSFFVPLELLHDHEFLDTITEHEEYEFGQWLNNPYEDAVFFLDAVDELKLRRGTLRKAIRKVKAALESQIHRAIFYISCRPNDWQNELDLEVISSLLQPNLRKAENTTTPSGEEVFTAVIAKDEYINPFSEAVKQDSDETVKVIALLPLSKNETVEFSRRYAPKQVNSFEAHLNDKELWHLYQLPEDIMVALDQLESKGRLGNLEEQLTFGIGKKLREVSNKKRNNLSEAKAMQGAERIALALFLMKRRSVYRDTTGGDAEGVCVADILVDWSQEEQNELLGKSIFDPTGVGAVRFHHRSTQEFLGARRLHKLRESGLATADLIVLLFANIRNEKVIIPSMEPVAAWMALWHLDVMTEVKERNPLLLFRQGIPSMLNFELREELIRRFVDRFAGSEWRRISVGHHELNRVATPELAPVVRDLWDQAYTGHDTRELLLELIYLTQIGRAHV